MTIADVEKLREALEALRNRLLEMNHDIFDRSNFTDRYADGDTNRRFIQLAQHSTSRRPQ